MPTISVLWNNTQTEAFHVATSLRNTGGKAPWEDLPWGVRNTWLDQEDRDLHQVEIRMPFASALLDRLTETDEIALALYDRTGNVIGAVFKLDYLKEALAAERASWSC